MRSSSVILSAHWRTSPAITHIERLVKQGKHFGTSPVNQQTCVMMLIKSTVALYISSMTMQKCLTKVQVSVVDNGFEMETVVLLSC